MSPEQEAKLLEEKLGARRFLDEYVWQQEVLNRLRSQETAALTLERGTGKSRALGAGYGAGDFIEVHKIAPLRWRGIEGNSILGGNEEGLHMYHDEIEIDQSRLKTDFGALASEMRRVWSKGLFDAARKRTVTLDFETEPLKDHMVRNFDSSWDAAPDFDGYTEEGNWYDKRVLLCP